MHRSEAAYDADAMLADGEHDGIIAEDGGRRIDASGERFAEDDDIWPDIFPVACQHASRSTEARLHFVGNQQHIVFLQQCRHFGQVSFIGHHDTRFALDRLQHERSNVRIRLEFIFQRWDIVEGDELKSGHKGTCYEIPARWPVARNDGCHTVVHVACRIR